jgi:hypothetical protein
MNFSNPVTIASLNTAFQEAVARAEKDFQWYASRTKRHRTMSILVRGVTIVAGILGVILPLTTKGPVSILGLRFDGPAEAGYACLLVAVLVLGLDHVFMISGTWIRYINAMTKIRTIILKAEFDWARMKSSMASDGAAHEQRDKAYELFQRLVLDSRKVIEDETSAWGSELGQAFQKLEGLVKEQRVGLETLHKEEKKTREEAEKAAGAPTTGGVTVEIDKIEKLQGAITVAVDEHVIERSMPIHRVVFPRVPAGQHAVMLTGTDASGKQVRAEDLVVVEANKVTNVKLSLQISEPPEAGSRAPGL